MPVSWFSKADSRRIAVDSAGDFTSTRSSLRDVVRPSIHAPVTPSRASTASAVATPTRSHRRVVHVESPRTWGGPALPVICESPPLRRPPRKEAQRTL